jgi:hypothetical protein
MSLRIGVPAAIALLLPQVGAALASPHPATVRRGGVSRHHGTAQTHFGTRIRLDFGSMRDYAKHLGTCLQHVAGNCLAVTDGIRIGFARAHGDMAR